MREAALWHDVECGGYGADLALWAILAEQAAGPVLELGCGTGRVALELAGRGGEVTGVDSDPALVASLRTRAEEQGLEVEAIVADARDLALGRRFELVLAPMQLVHLLAGPAGRRAMLCAARRHLSAGGRLAVAMLSDDAGASAEAGSDGDGGPRPLPDVREHKGWVYSSLPVAVERFDGTLEVRRLRQTVSPRGDLAEELETTSLELLAPAEFEIEASAEGFRPLERLEIPATDEHVGSTVVVMEAR